MDPLGAVALPGQRRLERVAVGGLAAGRALHQADRLAVGDVDGGQQGAGVIGLRSLRSKVQRDHDERRQDAAAASTASADAAAPATSSRAARSTASDATASTHDRRRARPGCAGRAAGRAGRAASRRAAGARPRSTAPARAGLAGGACRRRPRSCARRRRGRAARRRSVRARPARRRPAPRPRSLLTACRTQLRSSAAPASPDFSGWNWVARQRAVLDRGDERLAVLGGGDHAAAAASSARRRARTSGRSRSGCRRRQAGEQRRAGRRVDGVPAHVRQHRRVQPVTAPGSSPRPLVTTPCSSPRVEQDLHADADAEHRPAGRDPVGDHRAGAERLDAGHAGRVRARRPARPGRRPRPPRPRSAVTVTSAPARRQRPLGRAQVARAVVEDDDLLHSRPRYSRSAHGRAAPRPRAGAAAA